MKPDEHNLRSGDRRALARAITLLESTRAEDRADAEKLLRAILPDTGNAIRIGVSGAPGVGKSTFIETFGTHATENNYRVAVLTVDPSSSLSGGSILGDKTRMQKLAANPRAFIRPTPAGDKLGGVAHRTREAILACEAAGFDMIIVETVGVGQSETMVAAMTDIFLLMVSPAAGDELQGIKRGIMELADIVIVNKSDGALTSQATIAAADITHALRFLQRRAAWEVPVVQTSAIEKTGIDEVQKNIDEYRHILQADGALQDRRRRQARDWLWNETREELFAALKKNHAVADAFDGVLQKVTAGELPASAAARELVNTFTRSP